MRVLVVDDNDDTSFLLSKLVESCGCESRIVNRPDEAVDAVQKWSPDFVFLDLAMPRMDGYQVATAIRSQCGDVACQIHALSGYPPDVAKLTAAQFDGHFLKPITVAQLRALFSTGAAGKDGNIQSKPETD